MEEKIIKILSTINKPYHYFTVGIVLIGWSIFMTKSFNTLNMFLGTIFIAISLASLLEWLQNEIKKFFNKKKYEEKIINFYKNMQGKEREVIDNCIKNNTLTYYSDECDDDETIYALYSLVGKRFGTNLKYGGDFALSAEILSILNKYIKDKKIEK